MRMRLANLSSATRAFVVERCQIGNEFSVEKDALYRAWCYYAEANKVFAGTLPKFSESLYAATGHRVRPGRPVVEGKQVPSFVGIRLQPEEPRPRAEYDFWPPPE